MRTYVYRLYPTTSQERTLLATVETCRRVYNDCLAERKAAWEDEQRTVTKFEQLRLVKDIKATNPYAKDIHSHILQVAVADVDQAFFRRVKTGEKAGYPRFKGRNRFASFGLKEYGNGFRVDGRRLKVRGVGRIAVRWHRPLPCQPRTLRIVHRADGWYACFCCDVENSPLPATGETVGIDVGLYSLLATSDGETVEHPRWYRVEQGRLRITQRRIARRTKGGANRRKAVAVLRRQHQRIANRRRDFLNKVAHGLVQRYDMLVIEDLRIASMTKNRHLAKGIMDAGWGYFTQHLTHKAAEAGRVVLFVNPAWTSQTCSGCGQRFPEHLDLSVRRVHCACGLSCDRDVNAARNILYRGAGHAPWDVTPAMAGVSQEAVGL
jgi:putative transposase